MTEPLLSYTEFFSGCVEKKNIIFITHGLFGSKRNWMSTAKALSEELNQRVVVIDIRNHGSSFWSDTHDYSSLGEDLLRLADHFGSKVDLVGHSMGGKAVMSASLLNPKKFGRLVVIDIGPVIYEQTDFVEFISGMKQLDMSDIISRRHADQFLTSFVPDQNVRSFLLQNLVYKETGKYEWKMNLRSIEKNMAEIASFPTYQGQFLGKTLFIKGSESTYISDSTITEIKRYFPHHSIVKIEQAGHWPHIDQPKAFQEKLINFLTEP